MLGHISVQWELWWCAAGNDWISLHWSEHFIFKHFCVVVCHEIVFKYCMRLNSMNVGNHSIIVILILYLLNFFFQNNKHFDHVFHVGHQTQSWKKNDQLSNPGYHLSKRCCHHATAADTSGRTSDEWLFWNSQKVDTCGIIGVSFQPFVPSMIGLLFACLPQTVLYSIVKQLWINCCRGEQGIRDRSNHL